MSGNEPQEKGRGYLQANRILWGIAILIILYKFSGAWTSFPLFTW